VRERDREGVQTIAEWPVALANRNALREAVTEGGMSRVLLCKMRRGKGKRFIEGKRMGRKRKGTNHDGRWRGE